VILRPSGQSDSSIFSGGGVLAKCYRRDARTNFDAKYAELRGSAQESAFWGVAKPISKVYTLTFFSKTAILGPDGTYKFSPENGFNTRRLESKRSLIVVVDGRSVDGRTARLIDRVIA